MNKHVYIAGRKVGKDHPVFIIAEAGVNHNGSFSMAKKMVEAVKLCGADAIKFQTFKAEELVTSRAPKARYQRKNSRGRSQFDMLKRLELNEAAFEKLKDYCAERKIMFLSTPFDSKSARFLNRLKMPAFKISSGELTNIPLISQVAGYKKPVILSTGMSTMEEIERAVSRIYSAGNKKLILLHCTSNYPAQYKDINLKAMDTLSKRFKVPVGYSDHTPGIEVSVAAVAKGAYVIEKHFTLDRMLPGPDHKASLEPRQFKEMVNAIRNIESAMGDGIKCPRGCEAEIKKTMRKSVVAVRDIPGSAVISADMLAIKRPGTGISPEHINILMNKRLTRDIKKDQVLTWEMVRL